MIIPLPTYTESEPEPRQAGQYTAEDYAWIRWYINCPNWTCVECGAVMFGRTKYCVYCKMKLGKHTPRPISYVESLMD